MKPQKFPYSILKTHFLGFSVMLYFELAENFFICQVGCQVVIFDYHVVYVNF